MQYEALRDLTGMPVVLYITSRQSEQEVWLNLLHAVRSGYLMTASCLTDYQGIVGGQAYTLLGVQDIFNDDKKLEAQLIRVRNTVGVNTFTGNWHNTAHKWEELDYMKQADHDPQDQTRFYISLQDFVQAFANYDITYYNNDWKSSRAFVSGSGKKWLFPFKNIKQMEVFLTFDTESTRMYPPNCYHGDRPEFNILLRCASKGTILAQEPISMRAGYGVIHMRSLPPGMYQLIVVNFGNTKQEQEYTVTSYAEDELELLEQHH